MALPTSGPISMSAINIELNYIPANGTIWMGHQWLRDLSGQQGNPVRLSVFYGKSKVVATPLSVSSQGGSAGNGQSNVDVTFTANVDVTANPSGGTPPYSYQWSTSSGVATLSNTTSQVCRVSYRIPRYGIWADVPITVVVTDAAGATASVNTFASFQYGVAP